MAPRRGDPVPAAVGVVKMAAAGLVPPTEPAGSPSSRIAEGVDGPVGQEDPVAPAVGGAHGRGDRRAWGPGAP